MFTRKLLLSNRNITNVKKVLRCRFVSSSPSLYNSAAILCDDLKTSETSLERVNFIQHYHENKLKKVTELNRQDEEEENVDATEGAQDENQVQENTESLWYHKHIVTMAGFSDIIAIMPEDGIITEEVAGELLKADWNKMKTQELVDNFVQLSWYINVCLENEKEVNYEVVMSNLKDHLSIMSDAQLESVLKYYQLLRRDKDKSEMQPFIRALDKELLYRIYDMTIENRLKLSDLLQVAGLSKQLKSFYKLMKMMKNKIHQLSQSQLVNYAYLLASNKHCPQPMYELEYHLEKFHKQMDLNQLSLICLLFFKRKYQAKNNSFNSLVLRHCVDHVEEMQSYNVSSIMKFCRSFRNKDEVDIFKELLLALEPRLDKYNWIVLSHIAQAAANHSLYIESITNKIMNRFINDPESFRLKDYERMAIAVSTYNFGPKHPVVKTIVDLLKCPAHRSDEIQKYTKSVPITCMFLGQTGYYNLSLLEKVMDPKFYTPLYTNMLYNTNLEYLWLDQSIEIEIPDFKGCRLDEKVVLKYINKYKATIPNLQSKFLSKYNKLALDVLAECQNCFGASSVAFSHVLPHYVKPDLVIAMDSFNKPLPVKEIISNSETIKYIPDEYRKNNTWYAIIVGTDYSCLHNTNQPTGFVSSKMRQLHRIGYTPVLVNVFEWQQIQSKSKRYYLESLLHDEKKRPQFKNELFIE